MPAHTDWLYHHLRVTGAAATLATFRDAACGAGVIPWVLDLDRVEEDAFLRLAASPQHRLSLEGARLLAGELRGAVGQRHAMAVAQVGRSRACPLDLHALLPVPGAVLRLGRDHPEALAWLWAQWVRLQHFGTWRCCRRAGQGRRRSRSLSGRRTGLRGERSRRCGKPGWEAYTPARPPLLRVADASVRITRLLSKGVAGEIALFLPPVPADGPEPELRCRAALASTLMAGLELARSGAVRVSQAQLTEPITMELPPIPSHNRGMERDHSQAPAEWIDALARADDDIVHNRTASVDEVLDELHVQLAELEAEMNAEPETPVVNAPGR